MSEAAGRCDDNMQLEREEAKRRDGLRPSISHGDSLKAGNKAQIPTPVPTPVPPHLTGWEAFDAADLDERPKERPKSDQAIEGKGITGWTLNMLEGEAAETNGDGINTGKTGEAAVDSVRIEVKAITGLALIEAALKGDVTSQNELSVTDYKLAFPVGRRIKVKPNNLINHGFDSENYLEGNVLGVEKDEFDNVFIVVKIDGNDAPMKCFALDCLYANGLPTSDEPPEAAK